MLINITGKLNGEVEIDLIITNAKVYNVFTMEFMEVDVMIDKGMVIGFGQGKAKKVIDASGQYMVPGLIDSHMHIESTMLSPVEYSKVALANGVTTVFADCHEIANVLGTNGIDFMLCEVERALMDINLMLPSSVPCSNINNENNVIAANDLIPYYSDPFVYGLAEVMDYSRVEANDKDYVQKIKDSRRRNLTVDGHMSGLKLKEIDLLRNHGVSTDHECETKEDLIERISRGVNVHIREGSAAKNFSELMSVINLSNYGMVSFCTDDVSIVDLIEKGSINNIIRKGIKEGYPPELLIKMATINAARAYNLTEKGAIAPGYVADLLLLDNLEEFKINKVIKDGLVMNGQLDFSRRVETVENENVFNALNIVVDEDAIDYTPKHNIAIEVVNGSLVTTRIEVSDDEIDDLTKVVVINRYGKDDYFVSYIKGFELESGVIASSISHDYHNVVIIGKYDDEIRAMIKFIKTTQGGIYTLLKGKIDYCKLDIAGLMSAESINTAYSKFKSLLEHVNEIELDEPFLAMSFLTLDVIPALKITDNGLYDNELKSLIQ